MATPTVTIRVVAARAKMMATEPLSDLANAAADAFGCDECIEQSCFFVEDRCSGLGLPDSYPTPSQDANAATASRVFPMGRGPVRP